MFFGVLSVSKQFMKYVLHFVKVRMRLERFRKQIRATRVTKTTHVLEVLRGPGWLLHSLPTPESVFSLSSFFSPFCFY